MKWERLNPTDEGLVRMMILPIDTLTWLEAPVDTEHLRQRTVDIVRANPWLAGALATRKTGATFLRRSWGIRYDPSISEDPGAVRRLIDKRRLFRVADPRDTDLRPEQPYETQNRTCHRHRSISLKPGGEAVGGPLWKVTVLPTADQQHVGLYVSMSHVIADGHTYYKLLEALLGTQVPQLQVARLPDTKALQETFMGKTNSDIIRSSGFVSKLIGGMIGQSLLGGLCPRRWKTRAKVYNIDTNKIAQLKRQNNETPFVSTNDILTSWFLQTRDVGLMSVNLRGKLEGHHDDLAGNYENTFFYRRPDSVSPGLIRRSLPAGRRVVTADKPYSNVEPVKKTIGLVTNWSSFYPKNIDERHKLIAHLPMLDLSCTPTLTVCVIARVNKEQLALFMMGTDKYFDGLDVSRIAVDAKV